MSTGFDLKPQSIESDDRFVPRGNTLTLLIACALVVILVGGFFLVTTGSKKKDAEAALVSATAKQQQLALESQKLNAELAALQGQGGAVSADLVNQLIAERFDWYRTFNDLARISRPYRKRGLKLYLFTADAPNGPTGLQTVAGEPVDFGVPGRARTGKQVRDFLNALRNFKGTNGEPLFSFVGITGAARAADVAPASGESLLNSKVPFDFVVGLAFTRRLAMPQAAIPAAPAAPTTPPATTPPS